MDQDLHHPSPRLPQGWKQFQADNIDVTTIGGIPTLTGPGHHSRSASAFSNHGGYINTDIIQPSQMQNVHNKLGDSIYGEQTDRGGGGGDGQSELIGMDQNTTPQYEQQRPDLSHFRHSSVEEYEYHANPQTRSSIGGTKPSNTYFHLTDTAPLGTATGAESSTLIHNNSANNSNTTTNTNTHEDPSFYDPSSSPFVNPNPPFTGSTTSTPLIQDTLSPFAPYHNSFDAAQHQQQQTFEQYEVRDNNTLGPHYSHYRSLSEQSDISSNAPSPYFQSIHSEQGSPFIAAQEGDNTFEDDLLESLLELDMGAPFDPVVAQYQNNHQTYDTSNLPLDQGGFPIDAPPYPTSSDRQEQQYYDQQQPSRPTSSHSYTHPTFPQSIFTSQPSHISTSIPPAFTSPPLNSAASIPEIEVTVAPPTPRTQAYFEYFPQPYSRQNQQQSSGSPSNSPSIPPRYLYNTQEFAPLSLPATGRRRAVSDSGARPNFGSMMPPSANNTTLVRRVSSGSHPYLGVHENGGSSGRSTPSRGHHRKSFSHGHNMTAREVLELVKNEGPREAKNPKKFICDYPGCGQRFTRNSNKTTHMLTHKNERPHVCPQCHKDFTRQHDWKRHMELHDPSKKFKCAGQLIDGRPWGCNKEFARKDALSRHFKSQQGRQCIDEVLREGRTLEDLYEAQGISMGQLSGNSSEGMYDE